MKNRDFIYLAVFALVTVMFWMFFEAVYTSKKSTVTKVLKEQIRPINPTFDVKTLRILKDRQGQ